VFQLDKSDIYFRVWSYLHGQVKGKDCFMHMFPILQ